MRWWRRFTSQTRTSRDWLHAIESSGKLSSPVAILYRCFSLSFSIVFLTKITFLFLFVSLQDVQGSSNSESSFHKSGHGSSKSIANGSIANSNGHQSAPSPRGSFTSSQLLAQRKCFAESKIGRSSFQKLLEPSPPERPGIAPYRIVLGHVKDKVLLLFAASNLSNAWSAVHVEQQNT